MLRPSRCCSGSNIVSLICNYGNSIKETFVRAQCRLQSHTFIWLSQLSKWNKNNLSAGIWSLDLWLWSFVWSLGNHFLTQFHETALDTNYRRQFSRGPIKSQMNRRKRLNLWAAKYWFCEAVLMDGDLMIPQNRCLDSFLRKKIRRRQKMIF